MKKRLVLLTIFVMMMLNSFIGCGSKTKSDDGNSIEEPATEVTSFTTTNKHTELLK